MKRRLSIRTRRSYSSATPSFIETIVHFRSMVAEFGFLGSIWRVVRYRFEK